TLLMGALFPLVVRIVHARPGRIAPNAQQRIQGDGQDLGTGSASRTVGQVYAVNTIRAIGGAFASGFILVPWLGLVESLRVCVAINFVIAGALFAALGPMTGSTAAQSGTTNAPKRARGQPGPSRARTTPPLRAARRLGLAAVVMLILATGLFKPTWD